MNEEIATAQKINLGLLILLGAWLWYGLSATPDTWQIPGKQSAALNYMFNKVEILEESGRPELSSNPFWWLNSGAYFYFDQGVGRTVRGNLPENSRWRLAYAKTNPVDTENGFKPQNIFRLFTQNVWYNSRIEGLFKIDAYNHTASPRRHAGNGLSLISRFQNNENGYIFSLRIDGSAAIKKKINGTYYELVYRPDAWVEGMKEGLPLNTWIGLASEISDNTDGSVSLRMFIKTVDSDWRPVVEVTDVTNESLPPIKAAGRAGLRSDFMDLEVKELKIIGL